VPKLIRIVAYLGEIDSENLLSDIEDGGVQQVPVI